MKSTKSFLVSTGLLAITTMAGVVGCGGGGNSGVANGGVGRPVRLFVTDSFREDVDQVFLTIAKVELITTDGAVTVAYDDPIGHQFDAKSLRDNSGQIYNFLANASIPAQLCKSVRVTLDGGFTLAPKDQVLTKTLKVDESFPKDSQGRSQIQFDLATPKDLSASGGNFVIDIDLAKFRYNGSRIIPVFAEGTTEGLNDPARHQDDEYRGVVSSLTANQFQLALGNARNLPVTIAPNAVIFDGEGTGRDELASGQTVEAVGKISVGSGRFVATEIRIVNPEDGNEPARPQVNGLLASFSRSGDEGTINLTVGRAKGFLPGQTSIKVKTAAVSTTYIDRDGSPLTDEEFFAALKPNSKVYAEGSYQSAGNTFTATIAKIE
jgi:hypothetical protein